MTTQSKPMARRARGARAGRSAAHVSRAAVPALAIAFIVACGGAPTVAPTAAPTATPTVPTPTPFDVGAAFLEIVNAPGFSARIDLEGTMELGVTASITGTIEGSGDDSRQTMSFTLGSTVNTTESISLGGRDWSRKLPGPWLVEAPDDDGDTIRTWLGALATLDDLGVETKGGIALHHLRPIGGSKVPPAAFGFDQSTVTNPDISIELYAKDDGTPALYEVRGTWIQKANGQDVTVTFAVDMTVSNVGKAVQISAPTDVWTAYTSELGYTAAHPAGFTVERGDNGDTYRKDGTDWFYVFTYPDGKGMTAEGFRDAILTGYAEDPGPPREAPVAVSVSGGPAWKAVFEFEANDGGDVVLVDVLTVHADLGWEIGLVTVPTLEAAEAKVFETFLASFEFTK